MVGLGFLGYNFIYRLFGLFITFILMLLMVTTIILTFSGDALTSVGGLILGVFFGGGRCYDDEVVRVFAGVSQVLLGEAF